MSALCRTTGIPTDDCAHCPMQPAVLPEPAAPTKRPTVTTRDPAHAVLSPRLRERLLGRGRGEWFPSSGKWSHCWLCKRKMAEGEPIRFRYGRTAKDMATQGWCCEALDNETVKAILRRVGVAGNEPTPEPKDDAPKPTRGRSLFG